MTDDALLAAANDYVRAVLLRRYADARYEVFNASGPGEARTIGMSQAVADLRTAMTNRRDAEARMIAAFLAEGDEPESPADA